MAEILIRTLTHCVGSVAPESPEITLPKGRVVYCEESLAQKFIALSGAVEATPVDLAAQEIQDAKDAQFQAMMAASLGQ